MSDSADQNSQRRESSVVVLFGGEAGREMAVQFCDSLVNRFWTNCSFNVDWWSFALLERADAATEARSKALGADLVVFAPECKTDLPLVVKAWVQEWLNCRGCAHEGSLVCLVPESGEETFPAAHCYLRDVAHRAGMDFLTRVPQTVDRQIPDSLDSFQERAGCVTGILDDILHQPKAPAPVGLR